MRPEDFPAPQIATRFGGYENLCGLPRPKGRRSRAACGQAGDQAPPDGTRLDYSKGPMLPGAVWLAALSRASGARAESSFANDLLCAQCMQTRRKFAAHQRTSRPPDVRAMRSRRWMPANLRGRTGTTSLLSECIHASAPPARLTARPSRPPALRGAFARFCASARTRFAPLRAQLTLRDSCAPSCFCVAQHTRACFCAFARAVRASFRAPLARNFCAP